jgi:hypothetical protein
VVPNEFLFQAFEMEISAISQQLCSMVLIPYMQWVASKEMKELGKGIC